MMKNYLQTALRNLMKNKFYSAINIVGLAIGITACILIMLYVQNELSYDRFNEKADRIYRVNLRYGSNNDSHNLPQSSPPLRNAMQNEIPEVEEAVRVTKYWQPVMQYKNKVFNETKWCFADANFFKVFSTFFIYGDPNEALEQPYTVVLTETTAKRYFGNENPIGRTLYSLNRNFMKWVAIAFVISCPIVWFTMSKWLESFAYKTTLSWWVFVLAGFAALGVTIVTVSWISWRVATRNPVEAFRYE